MFLATSLSTTSLNFFTSTGTVFNLPASKSSTFVFELFKLRRILAGLFTSSLSTSAFKAIKYCLAAKPDASLPVARSIFLRSLTSQV